MVSGKFRAILRFGASEQRRSSRALARPERRVGLARSHGYSDGQKRITFMAMTVFLDVNYVQLDAPEPEVVRAMLAVADGDMSEADLARWVRENSQLAPGA